MSGVECPPLATSLGAWRELSGKTLAAGSTAGHGHRHTAISHPLAADSRQV